MTHYHGQQVHETEGGHNLYSNITVPTQINQAALPINHHDYNIYVTVHAKTSLVHTKIEIIFLSPAYSYTH